MSNYSVTKNPDGGWNAKKDGASRASFHGQTQAEVEHEAKRLSSNSGGGEVRIQGRDGRFRDSDTVFPGRDPNPPKDKVH